MPSKSPSGLPEQLVDLTFPVAGIDLAMEFELQTPQTTPVGQNVRAYEALTQRRRGGSRPGLSQYIPQTVGNPSVIQHLNYIVDPQAGALETTFDPLDTPIVPLGIGWGFGSPPDGVSFPDLGVGFPAVIPGSDNPAAVPGEGGVLMPNGFYTRTGGNGIQPNRNVGTKQKTPPAILFVQSNEGSVFSGSSLAVAFLQNVGLGDLLVVGAYTVTSFDGQSTVGISDSAGNSYLQIGSYVTDSLDDNALSLWYAVSAHAGPNIVTVNSSGSPSSVQGAVLEYTGTAQSGVLHGMASNFALRSLSANVSTSPVAVSSKELIVGAFIAPTITPDTGFTARILGIASSFGVLDNIVSTTGAAAVTGVITGGPSPYTWLAIGASFKPE